MSWYPGYQNYYNVGIDNTIPQALGRFVENALPETQTHTQLPAKTYVSAVSPQVYLRPRLQRFAVTNPQYNENVITGLGGTETYA